MVALALAILTVAFAITVIMIILGGDK